MCRMLQWSPILYGKVGRKMGLEGSGCGLDDDTEIDINKALIDSPSRHQSLMKNSSLGKTKEPQ